MSAKPNISVPAASSDAPLRPISFGDPVVSIDRRDDGTISRRPKIALGEVPLRLTARLHHWAKTQRNRIFMAERDAGGLWRQMSYAQLLASSRHIASGLLTRGLSADKPIVILSGNSIDHALLAFGTLYAGITFCPVSPAYSLISKDSGTLGFVMKLLTPGLVFADDATKFAEALSATVPPEIEIAASRGEVPGRKLTKLGDLQATPEHPGVDAAHDAIGPDTTAKFLLTSVSTGNPTAVTHTHRIFHTTHVLLQPP